MGSTNNLSNRAASIFKIAYHKSVPFKYRYGHVFKKQFDFLMSSREWDTAKLLEYQDAQFRRLIQHVYKNVPYYRNVMQERGLTPKSFNSVDDISLMPILTKDIIRENFSDLIAQNMRSEKAVEFRTSGSTGKKLVFLGTDAVFKKEAAFVLRSFKDHGATMYDKPSVWLRRYVPKSNSDPLWKYDHELRRLYMSAYHLSSDTIEQYIKKINHKKYHTLVGYPSSIFILACLCEEKNLRLKNIQAIHVASEKMLTQWREKIEAVFDITPKSHYGMQEKVCFHHQKRGRSEYYDNVEYGITEFVKEGDQKVIVGTGFINEYMPFIRYKTNDTAILNPKNDKLYTMSDIEGRCDDILVSKDGCLLPGVNFYTMMYKIDGVKMFQIRQKINGDITVLIVPNERFCQNTKKQILDGLSSRVGNLDITIITVDKITRDKTTGKIRNIFREK